MNRNIKRAIWVYLLLVIFEGAFRKWVLPGMADLFLLIRDPIMILIYVMAATTGVFPRNNFIALLMALAAGSFVFAFLAGQSNIWVTLYGIRTNYLHPGLIWVMASVLDRRDVDRMGLTLLFIAIPTTLVMVWQFSSPASAWINLGVGGEEGGGIYGAAGKNRPPGFFSFISGVMVYFPIAAAFFLHFVSTVKNKTLWWLVVACGPCIVLAMPISISRGAAIATAAVGVVYVVCLAYIGLLNARVVRTGVAGMALMVVLSFLPVFREGQEAFMDRWNQASSEVEGEVASSLSNRVLSGFTAPFELVASAPTFGVGIGVGTNVGAKLMTGNMGFTLSENDWERSLLELGPLLGLAFIFFRVGLGVHLFRRSLWALRTHRDVMPMLLWIAVIPTVLFHQWGPATLLGFAVIGSGLLLASLNYVDEASDDEESSDEADVDASDDDEAENADDTNSDHSDDNNEEEEKEAEEKKLPVDPSPALEQPPRHYTDEELRRRRMRGLA